MPKEDFRREVEKELTGKEEKTVRADLFQGLQESDPSDRAGDRDSRVDVGFRQIARYYRFLPAPQKQEFLFQIAQNVS